MVTKTHKAPNLKAPRFRQTGKHIIDVDFFKALKEKHKKCAEYDNKTIAGIIKRFNETLWKEVIETRDGVFLPEHLGLLFIGTCQAPLKENIDFAKSVKYGVRVTNKNWETDGKLAKIIYTSFSNRYKFSNRDCWGFVACRNFKRSVAKSYPENWNMYIQVDPTKKLRKVYKKAMFKNKIKEILEKKLVNYNEFDL